MTFLLSNGSVGVRVLTPAARPHTVSGAGRVLPGESASQVWQEVVMVRVSVLYATSEGKKFDHDYYVKTHMKLVPDRLNSFGLVRTEVDKGLGGGAPGAPAPYVAIGHVYFNTLGDFQKGMGLHGKELLGDVPNFTNIQPQVQISEIIG